MDQKYNTLEYYNKNAQLYCEQTLIGNLQENYEKCLSRLPKKAYILPFIIGLKPMALAYRFIAFSKR